jgi:hypothetical protein
MFAPSVGCGHLDRCYAADFCLPLGIEKNDRVAYRLDASKLVRYFTSAGAPASRQRQTRREAGTQSLGASYLAGLSNGGATKIRLQRRGYL